MRWFRGIAGLVPWLIGLFLVAQLGGAVASDQVRPVSLAISIHQHGSAALAAEDHGLAHDHGAGVADAAADQCCALHLLAGILPPLLVAHLTGALGESLAMEPAAAVGGLGPSLVDRPPKTPPQSL
jgi:hypothetical protein